MRRRFPNSELVAALLFLAVASTVGVRLANTAQTTAKEVCFTNLAHLAQATLMYVNDNDGRFPPHQTPMEPYTCAWGADNSNPYLRWPVVLDPYLPDRSVYLCPESRAPRVGYGVQNHPNWITAERVTTKGYPASPCGGVYPPGWGGAITDSATQGRCGDPDRFCATVGGAMRELGGERLSSIENPQHHLLWADASRMWVNLGSILWAEACRADCADLDDQADWENCPWSQQCGAGGDFATNSEVRSRFTRHDGGSNIAFVDGHVKWMSVDQMIQAYREGQLQGAPPAPKTSGRPWYLR
jgi:prepilin-type processing-associated H-X9-DG protein